MPLSSRTLFSRLYAPPVDGARQAIALSRNEAEKIPFLDTVAIISITAPEKSPAKLAAFSHVLRLSFADVDFLATAKLSKRTEARLKKSVHSRAGGAGEGLCREPTFRYSNNLGSLRGRLFSFLCNCSRAE